MTKLVAERRVLGEANELVPAVWTGLIVMALLGLCGTAIVWFSGSYAAHDLLRVPEHLRRESVEAFQLLALSLPVVIGSIGLRGILEAHHSFRSINLVRIPMGIWTFLGPVLVLPMSHELGALISVLLIGRVIVFFLFLALVLRTMPGMVHIQFDPTLVRPLFGFGGWVTIPNIIGPVMSYLDRFFLGSLVSVAAVAYYTVAYEIATKMWVLPTGLSAVLFPAFAGLRTNDPRRATWIFERGIKYLFIALFPATLLIVTFAHEGLSAWLGPEYALHSTAALQLLAVGVFVNSLAGMAFTFLQSAGRPDLTAKVSFGELPIYLVSAWFVIGTFGVEGAAWLWVVRVSIESVVLFALAMHLIGSKGLSLRLKWVFPAALAVAIGCLPMPVALKVSWSSVALGAYAVLVLRSGLLSSGLHGRAFHST